MREASTDRRAFLSLSAAGIAGAMLASPAPAGASTRSKIAEAAPISSAERAARVAKAQRLLEEAGIGALLIEAGSSLDYFTGIDWWRSERLTAALIPHEGDITIVTPEFEEPSIREMLKVDADVRIWNEHQSPYRLVADWLRTRKIAEGRLAVEETTRYFAVAGVQDASPDLRIVSGRGIVNACRMIKSPNELALMQKASDITIAAYRETASSIEAGMEGKDVFALMQASMIALGGEGPSGGVQVNEGTALPHGSKERSVIGSGSTVLMDCGCGAGGYRSDISRTFVFGEPSKAQRRVFDQVRKGQDIAMETAMLGRAAGQVDDAVRVFYESLGYGPGYATPGLPHRTGHGIGMDVHEPINLVHGEETPLAAGMCFSNEPGIYIPGSFGVRIEDCFYMTLDGPRYFSSPPRSLDDPFA
jgi:Xaa-Pro dipeptidase